MKKILAMTTAALMSASVMAAPAFAQMANGEASGTETNATSEMPGVDTGTTQAIDESTGGNDALGSITGSASAAQSIAGMTEFGDVTVNQITGEDSDKVDQLVTENRQSIDELRAAIAGNPAVQSQLQAQGVDVAKIVGAEVALNGDLVLYSM